MEKPRSRIIENSINNFQIFRFGNHCLPNLKNAHHHFGNHCLPNLMQKCLNFAHNCHGCTMNV